MKKAIIIQKDKNSGTFSVLDGVMVGALSYSRVISKFVIMFNSKKEAADLLKNHPCGKGAKVITLNANQERMIATLKEINRASLYFDVGFFLWGNSSEH